MTERDYNELDCVCALDLETSGLNEQKDQILEVAAIFGSIKDGKFTERKRFVRVLPLITNIEDWDEKVVEMHSANGLIAEALKAKKADTYENAFSRCDRELQGNAPSLPTYKARWTLLGNSVHFDLRFVRRVFPVFAGHLSHRVIDVSSTRLFCEGLGMATEHTTPPHRALPDVLSSITQYEAQSEWVRLLGAAGITGHVLSAAMLDEERLGRTAVGHGAG